MSILAFLMQQSDSGNAVGNAAAAGMFGVLGLVWLVVVVLMVAAFWKIFVKAGQPGWAAIIPIYNAIVLLKIVGRPLWWLLLMLIPFVGLIFAFIVVFDLARAFGKGGAFALGMIILGPIFYPVLAWSDAKYQGAVAAA